MDTNFDDDDVLSLQSQPFSRSLEVPTAQKTGSASERLKPYLEELFTCLDRLNDTAEMESTGKLIEVEVGRLRGIIALSTRKRKRQVANVATVYAVVETRTNNVGRLFGTRNMRQYKPKKK